MFCAKCSNYNPDDAKICSYCGQPLSPQPAPQPGDGFRQDVYQSFEPQAEPRQNPGAGYQPYPPQAEPWQNPGAGYQPYAPQAENWQNPGAGYQSYAPQAEPWQNPGAGYQPYAPQAYGNQPVNKPIKVPGKGFGIVSMILGIFSLLSMCIPYLCLPLAIAGFIFGCISKAKAKSVGGKSGTGTAGVVCTVIAFVVSVGFILVAVLFAGLDLGGLLDMMYY